VEAFEEEVAAVVGRRYGVATSSGTAALQLVMQAPDVAEKRVLIPSYVCSALVHATHAAGAAPVLADVDGTTGNMETSPADAGECAAAIVPHMFGRPAAAAAGLSKQLPLIEDLAMALGSAGTGGWGIAAVCSLFATKVITSGGEGGMVLTDDAAFDQVVRELRGYDGLSVDRPRWNYKLTELGAAVGQVQLRRLPELLARRRLLAARYDEELNRWAASRPHPEPADISYRYVLSLAPGRLEKAVKEFDKLGIATRRPVGSALHEALGVGGAYPGTQKMLDGSLSLPLYPALSDAEAQRVVAAADQYPGCMKDDGNTLRSWSVDKLAVTVFVVFLFSGEARDLLNQSGLRWAYLLLLSFGVGVGFVITPLVYSLASCLGAMEVPSGRKAHDAPTALLGGVALYIAFAVTVLRNFAFTDELKGVALAGTLILAIGVIDDLRELPARWKLLVQLAAVAVLIRFGVVISFLPDTWWGTTGEWILTAIWVPGITNVVNFLDGMDGLAAGSTGINAIFFGLVAWQNGQSDMMFLALPLVGACPSFLVYNFRPGQRAWIFLGDAGSTFLGFMVASMGGMGDWASHHTVGLIVPILILGVPIFDMTFTTIMRVGSGQVRSFRQWIYFTGRDHIHHRLEDLRVGRVGAVLIIYGVTIWLGLSAMALKNTSGINEVLQVGQSVIVFFLLALFMVFVSRQYTEIADGAIDDAFGGIVVPGGTTEPGAEPASDSHRESE